MATMTNDTLTTIRTGYIPLRRTCPCPDTFTESIGIFALIAGVTDVGYAPIETIRTDLLPHGVLMMATETTPDTSVQQIGIRISTMDTINKIPPRHIVILTVIDILLMIPTTKGSRADLDLLRPTDQNLRRTPNIDKCHFARQPLASSSRQTYLSLIRSVLSSAMQTRKTKAHTEVHCKA